MARTTKQLVVRTAFPAEVDGRTVIVIAGARFPSTDPIVKAHPEMFTPAPRTAK